MHYVFYSDTLYGVNKQWAVFNGVVLSFYETCRRAWRIREEMNQVNQQVSPG